MARSYTLLSLEPTWRDRVLELLQSDQEGPVPLSSDDPEDKLLPRLGQLYGMLRRMGVPEERVKKCLDANQRIDLEEALEWVRRFYIKRFVLLILLFQLTLHSGKDELPWKKGKYIEVCKCKIKIFNRIWRSRSYNATNAAGWILISITSTNTSSSTHVHQFSKDKHVRNWYEQPSSAS